MTEPPPATSRVTRSRLAVLAGPTAVGKGTVAADVRRHHPEVWISVSATTRAPRPGEEDGVHYWFVSDEEFDRMVAEDELLEWAVVHQAARYGTPREPVEQALADGRPALLEIDLQGARQVRETMPEALFVFLMPPRGTSWSAGWSAGAPRAEEERERRLDDRAGGAGRRGGVRRDDRQPRSSRCCRGVGSLDLFRGRRPLASASAARPPLDHL